MKFISLCMAAAVASVADAFTVEGNWAGRDDFQPDLTALATEPISVVFAVRQRNLDEVERILLEVSDPNSAEYGQHLSHQEVHELTANKDATQAVVQFCKDHNLVVTETSEYGEYLTVEAPVATWSELLSANFMRLQHETGSVVRSKQYTMPTELDAHVAHVFNVVELPLRSAPPAQYHLMSEAEIQEQARLDLLPYPYPCKSVMKMDCWNYRYNQTSNDASGQSQMVFGQKGAYMALDDIPIFASSNQIDLGLQNFSCPNGGCSNTKCQGYDPSMHSNGVLCVEGNMDAQFISGVAQGAKNTFYWNTNLATPFLEFITHVSSMSAPPGSLSISYGSYEYEMDAAIMDQFTAEAMKLGAQGVSIIAATGDDGVAGYKARNDTSQCKYTVSFPATCPWVTSVGGTQNAENDPEDHEVHTLKEYAANAIEQQGPFFKVTTAGGFSNHFPVASYQAAAVKAYFATPESKRAAPGYNTTGRGIPDIASNALNWQTFINADPALVCGTSGAAPAFAGMVTAVNAARAKQNKPKLGFLNPLLYTKPTILNDISHGWNNCTAVPAFCCKQGFTGASGWDPLVGLGSPSYIRLLEESM